jgi:catalase
VAFLPPVSPLSAARAVGGARSDLVGVDVPGFFAATPAELLAFLEASGGAGRPSGGERGGLDAFLASHPITADYLQRAMTVAPPSSWLAVTYHAGHAVVLVDERGTRRPGRFRLMPTARAAEGGATDDAVRLTADEVAARGPDYLHEDLVARVAAGTAALRLVVQLAEPADPTDDVQRSWPEDRPVVDLGMLVITAVLDRAGSDGADLSFDVARLGDGLAPSADPLIAARSQVYARSFARRRAAAEGVAGGSAGDPEAPDRC